MEILVITTESPLAVLLSDTGSLGFHCIMRTEAILKHGLHDNPGVLGHSWNPTNDLYANLLLRAFNGVPYTSEHSSIALFLRTLVAIELLNYLLTGEVEEELYNRVREMEMYFHHLACCRYLDNF
jgi:hypothetical protein